MINKRSAKKRAEENIERFLRELYAQIPEDSEEIHSNNYYSDIFQSVWLVRTLNEYDERKQQAKKELSSFSEQIELERVNGFKRLSSQEKYEVNEIRRFEAEKIVMNANLGINDTTDLLIPIVLKIYKRGGFNTLNKYKINISGRVIRNYQFTKPD